ncbi:universal stress protein [Amycolatopsis keratiniphila]|uniref:Universal stress protein n=1 Tax=Amycolatopsis keratiniphila TaxID=129921 RepID=R4T9K2_9PSEU|nr:universal stress protein [Amycolatopsis keratiniphila]AGM07213.1 universal stress protein [Amycolatopsis keratiniphila]
MNTNPDTTRHLLVGADGSAESEEAIRWAITEATAVGDKVEILMVLPREELLPGTSFALQPHGRVPVRKHYSLDEAVARIQRELHADIDVTTMLRQGNPTSELLAAARDADMLVLGTGTKSAVGRLVFGSVSTACVRHATCPVVLVSTQAVHRFSPTAS